MELGILLHFGPIPKFYRELRRGVDTGTGAYGVFVSFVLFVSFGRSIIRPRGSEPSLDLILPARYTLTHAAPARTSR